MTRLLTIIALLGLLYTPSLYGETPIKEEKGVRNTYQVFDGGEHFYFIKNINNNLWGTDPEYNYPLPWTMMKVMNLDKIRKIVYDNIYPFIKNKLSSIEELYSFGIILFSDQNGKLTEIYFSSPREWNIPVITIEKIELAIFSSGAYIYLPKVKYLGDFKYIRWELSYNKRFFEKWSSPSASLPVEKVPGLVGEDKGIGSINEENRD